MIEDKILIILNMNRLFKNILLVFSFALLIVSCNDKNKGPNYAEMEAMENKLLEEFYDNSQAWDSLRTMAKDTIIDDRETTGLHYLEIIKGTGDSIILGQQVGIRYTYYVILYDLDDVPRLYFYDDNKNDEAPYTYTVGSPPQDLFVGVDLGVRKMRNHGKSIMILPSRISTDRQYYTVIAEVDVDFIEFVKE